MDVKAIVAVADSDETFPISFIIEPKLGDILPLTVAGETREYVIVDIDTTGFENSVPYLYRIYVKPKL
jgi:hypothetical protein